jgi:tetratricopeptide (TPR) repeat protein
MNITPAVLGILVFASVASAQEKELEAALKEARTHGAQSFEVARALALLGVFYQDAGRFPEAQSALLNSLNIVKRSASLQHESQAPLISRLAWLYIETGQTTLAKRLHLDEWVHRLSESRSDYLPAILESAGGVYALQGDFRAAEELFHWDFDLLTERGDSASIMMASALNNFGFIQLNAGRYKEALDSFSRALPLWTKLAGPDDLEVAMTHVGMAETYTRLGRYDDSSQLFVRVLPIFEAKCGSRSLRTADVLDNYSRVLRYQKRKAEAKLFEDRARQIREAFAKNPVPGASVDVRDLPSYTGGK